jgi:tetratricopeptide (TPR) repeat protein
MIATSDGLRSIATRIQREREVARSIVASLPAELDAAWDLPLPDSWRTLGFAYEITSSAAAVLEQEPALSRSLAQFAVAVSTSLADGSYPDVAIAQVTGQAWKELGTAHRYLSSYDAALRAYAAARRCFEEFGALANEQASVDLATAVVLSEVGRHDEALGLIGEATPVLASFQDEKRVVQAMLLKAMIHHRRGDLSAARIAYEDALAGAERGDDLHTLAAIFNNMGQVLVELNDTNAAALALSRARDLFAALEMPAEVARSEYALAKLCLHTGDYDGALRLLQRVRALFLQLHLVEEAGVASLDMIDALVATGKKDDAYQVSEAVLSEFRAAGLNARALIALEYLRGLVRDHPASLSPSIRHVRSYLEELRTDPARVFLPLPDEHL